MPNVTRSTNTSTSFAVYDPARVIGNTSPEVAMPPPPPAPKGGCGALGTILVIVVAVVATVLTAGAAAPALAAATGTTITAGASVWATGMAALSGGLGAGFAAGAVAVGAAAVGGAVGSLASQGVAMAMGMQDKFSWKQVGLGAVGAGVTAGLGAAGVIGKTLVGSEALATAARAGLGNALTQGVAVATGLQDQFNWRSVAASAIAAPAAQAVSGAMSGTISEAFAGSALLQKTADNIVRGVVGQGVRMLVTRNGKIDYASIAADAFGNAIGESLAAPSDGGGGGGGQGLRVRGNRSDWWNKDYRFDTPSALSDYSLTSAGPLRLGGYTVNEDEDLGVTTYPVREPYIETRALPLTANAGAGGQRASQSQPESSGQHYVASLGQMFRGVQDRLDAYATDAGTSDGMRFVAAMVKNPAKWFGDAVTGTGALLTYGLDSQFRGQVNTGVRNFFSNVSAK